MDILMTISLIIFVIWFIIATTHLVYVLIDRYIPYGLALTNAIAYTVFYAVLVAVQIATRENVAVIILFTLLGTASAVNYWTEVKTKYEEKKRDGLWID